MVHVKYFLWACALAVMAVIFMFSSQTAPESDKVSKSVTEKVVDVMPHTRNLPDPEKKSIVMELDHRIRNNAHFILYFTLGIFIMLAIFYTFSGTEKKLVIIAFTICLAYAVSDEVHQIFVDGRSFQVTDILTDCLGSFAGSGAIHFLRKRTKLLNY